MKREKKPLSPWVYIAIGVLVAGYSFFIKKTSSVANQTAMSLFMYVGFLFLVIGLIRLVVVTLRTTPAGKKEEAFAQQLAGVQPRVDPQARRIIVCHKCGTKNYSTSHFCHMCGELISK